MFVAVVDDDDDDDDDGGDGDDWISTFLTSFFLSLFCNEGKVGLEGDDRERSGDDDDEDDFEEGGVRKLFVFWFNLLFDDLSVFDDGGRGCDLLRFRVIIGDDDLEGDDDNWNSYFVSVFG